VFARQAEVFAAFCEFTNHEIGRMLQAFDEVGQADNTLVFYIAGDSGTSGEGGMNGMFSELTYFNGVQEKVEDMLKLIDKWGGPGKGGTGTLFVSGQKAAESRIPKVTVGIK